GVVFRPRPASPGTTTIIADSAAINRGGVANTRVLVTLRDAHGNLLGVSGGIVLLTTTYGTLTAVTDHGDGTYSAVLTSALDAGVAVITGTLNGVAITSTATVQFRQART
ncbi:MAG TPA: Ig-like domain-containing protein, partial [Longimicrobiales bacterium]